MKRKYGCIGHTLRKSNIEVAHEMLEWNTQGTRRRDRLKNTWRRIIQNKTSKSFNELKSFARNRITGSILNSLSFIIVNYKTCQINKILMIEFWTLQKRTKDICYPTYIF